MSETKTKSLKTIEEKMLTMDKDSLRYHILENAKSFKTSWIELGRSLYSVWKDKLFRDWGYSNFDIYTAKEIGLKKPTALKLLRSYYFLEKEEPQYLTEGYRENAQAASMPGYEAIEVLRRAKNTKGLDEGDYAQIKKEVFEKGKDVSSVKKDLTALIRQREELSPEEAHKRKRQAVIKRLVGTLKTLKQEIQMSKLLPMPLIKQTEDLILKLEGELE